MRSVLLSVVIGCLISIQASEVSSLDAILSRLNALEEENMKLKESLNSHGYKFNLPEEEKVREVLLYFIYSSGCCLLYLFYC